MVENFLIMGKEIVNQVQEVQSLQQDTPKEEHTKTHGNQDDESYRQRWNVKSDKGKHNTTNIVQGNPIKLPANLSSETPQARREWQYI